MLKREIELESKVKAQHAISQRPCGLWNRNISILLMARA